MEIEVIFDREDCLYRFGEVVSGKVVVRPESDRTYSKIWIAYRWQTHGRGNRDKGIEENVILVEEKMSLKAGECIELPFRFETPNGPVTYHGHFLNVDWYLTAHAQSDPRSRSKPSEYDFLLLAGDTAGAVILGKKWIPQKDLPDRSIEVLPSPESVLNGKTGRPRHYIKWFVLIMSLIFSTFFCTWAFFMSLVSIIYHNLGQNWYLIILTLSSFILFFLTISAIFAEKLFKNTYKHKLELGEVWVKPTNVWRGGAVRCHVDFVAKRGFHLRSITASISAQERVTARSGTTEATFTYIVGEKIYTQAFNHDLSEGRRITFDCALPVGPDAPATFSCDLNHLEWTVTVKADIKGWPDWQMTFPITVLP